MRVQVACQESTDPIPDAIVQVRRVSRFDDFTSNQFVFDPIPVLVVFLGQRQELIGREEGSRRHRYYSSAQGYVNLKKAAMGQEKLGRRESVIV